MQCTNFDKMKLSIDVEKRFCKIYQSVISNYFLFNNELLSNTRKMLNAKKRRQTYKMDNFSYQLAFLLSFSVQDTCLSVQAFYQSLLDNTQIAEELSKINRIKLLCLGSESLPTAIGVCQVLDEIPENFGWQSNFEYLEIRVLVIENRQDWEHLCGCIVETANSHFKNIDLKLDFIKLDDSPNWTAQKLVDKIRESDLVIAARFFEKYRGSTLNLQFLKIVLHKMKEKAIIFWFDFNHKRYYKGLRRYISNINSFSEVKSSNNWQASFKKLADDEHCLDLAINWDTNCKSVMFSTWINQAVQNKECLKVSDIIVSDQPNPGKCAKKSKKASKEKGKKREIAVGEGDTNIIASQKSLQQTNPLQLQLQHSSLVTVPSVQHLQTMPNISLDHVKTAKIIMPN